MTVDSSKGIGAWELKKSILNAKKWWKTQAARPGKKSKRGTQYTRRNFREATFLGEKRIKWRKRAFGV